MEKYKLSQHITISSVTDDEYEDIPPNYQKDYYILYNLVRDKEYLINPTIKYFIDKFLTPKTEAQAISEVREDLKGDMQEVEETCSSFFHYLCKRKFLVPEELDETFTLRETLFTEGDTIACYTIIEVLANKKYMDVYSVTNENDKSPCVIKLLNRQKVKDESVYKQELFELEREYRLLRSAKHIPMMCQAYEFINNGDGNAYITLELINGKSLFDFLDETEGLKNRDLLEIIQSVLGAFALLHQSGIIHGDIHSSNILVSPDKSIKIIDLGLSRTVEVERDEILPFGGVNYYMPPERIDSSSVKKYIKEPDLYSDVYQLGLLLYLVLYNDLPFDGFIWEELAKNIQESKEVYPENSFVNEPISRELIEIIETCLSKTPEERYLNAGYIFQAFKKHTMFVTEIV